MQNSTSGWIYSSTELPQRKNNDVHDFIFSYIFKIN